MCSRSGPRALLLCLLCAFPGAGSAQNLTAETGALAERFTEMLQNQGLSGGGVRREGMAPRVEPDAQWGFFRFDVSTAGVEDWGALRAALVGELARARVTVVETHDPAAGYPLLRLFLGRRLFAEALFSPALPENGGENGEDGRNGAPPPPAPDYDACGLIIEVARKALLGAGVPESALTPVAPGKPPRFEAVLPEKPSLAEVTPVLESAVGFYGFYLEPWRAGPHRTVIRVSQGYDACLEIICVTPEAFAPQPAEEERPLLLPSEPPAEPVPPLVPHAPPAPPQGPALLAIILDDGGWGGHVTRRVLALDKHLTLAILPHTPFCEQTAREGAALGFEVMLHMPMETGGGKWPHEGLLKTDMDRETIQRLTREALAQVPGAAGVNNHTGTLFTTDAERLGWFMEVLKGEGLYFVDSRTNSRSVAYAVAVEQGLRALSRDVFLDNNSEPDYIRGQLDILVARAVARGRAVGIGHFRRNTVTVLEEALPGLEARGVKLVPLSELLP